MTPPGLSRPTQTRIKVARMKLRLAAPLIGLVAAGAPLLAQRPAVTAADYARAEKFLAPNLTGLVVGGAVTPNWLPSTRRRSIRS
jgi:hypothetical protein